MAVDQSDSGQDELKAGPRYIVNPWVAFLREYGPIPQNSNMYDESIQRVMRRTKVQPLQFDTGDILARIVADLKAEHPRSVLLTGTAGDGKTYLCREAWCALGGEPSEWDTDAKIKRIRIHSRKKLIVIKDLSELRGSDYKYLERMADSIVSEDPEELFLVAANDGQLVEAWGRTKTSDSVTRVRQLIEELLVGDSSEKVGYSLRLHNLSRTDSSELMAKILATVQEHAGWRGCEGCLGQTDDVRYRCPIWENLSRLRDSVFTDRLGKLLRLSDQDGYHLPIRQLLILASDLILGAPSAKNGLLQCRDVPQLVDEKRTGEASIYRNAFGGNLSPDRRANTEVFAVLGRFGIGDETSNQIDNMLIFGADDPKLISTFDQLVRTDPLYGASPQFLAHQAGYLDGTDESEIQEFLEILPSARQRLFFTIPAGDLKRLGLWELTAFHFAGEYLDEVLLPLRRGERPSRVILDRLVRGMNRVFTGILVSASRELVLTSSSSYSQSRISRIQEHSISVDPNRGEKVAFELLKERPCLAVHLDRENKVPLLLNLVKYEFLSRVADGALPISFSRECYEELLSFKTKLLQKWQSLRRAYGEEDPASEREVTIRVMQLDQKGTLVQNPISVKL